jgi:hypothetical protein
MSQSGANISGTPKYVLSDDAARDLYLSIMEEVKIRAASIAHAYRIQAGKVNLERDWWLVSGTFLRASWIKLCSRLSLHLCSSADLH